MASMPRARPPSSIRRPNACWAGRPRSWSATTCIRSCTTPIPTARTIPTTTARSTPRSATAPCIRSTPRCSGARTARRSGSNTPRRRSATAALVGAVIVFRDITQRREADEKLRAAHEEVERLRERLELENAYLQEEIRIEGNHHGIVGRSGAIQKTLRQVELVAPTDATVLITGETGTGKELVARAIHEASRRARPAVVRVNCAAIPRELFESELFGHVKGAFTGALRDRSAGSSSPTAARCSSTRSATCRSSCRPSCCACCRSGEFERVGEERTPQGRRARDRRDQPRPRAGGRRGRFREDLYYRLNVFPIELPPLRERRDDIPLLAEHFLQSAARELQCRTPRLTAGDARRLARYAWPGNVRELQNVIERAAILARNGRLRIDLPARSTQTRRAAAQAPAGRPPDRGRAPRARSRQHPRALESCNGKVFGRGGAAELLDVKPTTLAPRIKALGIRDERTTKPAAISAARPRCTASSNCGAAPSRPTLIRAASSSVGPLVRGQHRERRSGPEIARAADLVADDRHVRRHDDLLLAVLELEQDGRAVDAGHRRARRRAVGHGAVRHRRIGTMSLARAAHLLGEDVHFERLLRAVRLRHRGAAEERAFLDVGDRCLDHARRSARCRSASACAVAIAGLQRQRIAVDLLDGAAQAHGRRLLRGRDAHEAATSAPARTNFIVAFIVSSQKQCAPFRERRAVHSSVSL